MVADNGGTVFPRPHKWVSDETGCRRKAPLAPGEEWVDPDTGEVVRSPTGSAWSWQFTTGSTKTRDRRTRGRGGYPTEDAARGALADAIKAWNARHHDPGPPLAPYLADKGTADALTELVDLVDAGICSWMCLGALTAEHSALTCGCRCDGAYHSRIRLLAGRTGGAPADALARTLGELRGLAAIKAREHELLIRARALGGTLKDVGAAAGRSPEGLCTLLRRIAPHLPDQRFRS